MPIENDDMTPAADVQPAVQPAVNVQPAMPSSVFPAMPVFRTMRVDDIPQVAAIEMRAYEFPWTQQNFVDSLNAGYLGVVAVAPETTDPVAVPGALRGASRGADVLQAYAILMPAVDDLHILNLCVAPACQGRGMGQRLLAEIRRVTLALHIPTLLLEVRPSNTHAIRLYERSGFIEIGRRKNYYPARNRVREDAIVMRARLKRSDADASR